MTRNLPCRIEIEKRDTLLLCQKRKGTMEISIIAVKQKRARRRELCISETGSCVGVVMRFRRCTLCLVMHWPGPSQARPCAWLELASGIGLSF